MACKYKYNNEWYSKEELQNILYKERGIDKYGKLVKPEIKKEIRKKEFAVFDVGDRNPINKERFKTKEEAQKWVNENYEEAVEHGLEIYASQIEEIGIQPTQTKDNLKESIESVKSNLLSTANRPKSLEELQEGDGFIYFEENGKYFKEDLSKQENIEITKEEYEGKKEYTEQALINTKIAKLKEVAKRYPRSLIRSEVKRINTSSSQELYDQFGADELPFQKLSNTSQTEIDKITEELKQAENTKIVETVDEFFNITKSRLTKLLKNQNYKRLKELFTDVYGVNKYDSLQSLLRDANKAVEDVEGINRRIRAIAIGITQTDKLTDLVAEDVKNIISDKKNALNNITTLQYYLYTLNDWKLFLEDARKTFEGNPNTIKLIDNVLGKINAIDKNIINNDISGLIEAFKPILQPASEEYKKVLTDKLNYYNNLANNTKNPENKKNYQKIAKGFEDKIKQYDFSLDENIASFLKGERGDTNLYSYLLEAYSDSPDPVVGGFTVWLKNNIQDINSQVASIERDYESEIAPLYKQLGNRFNPEDIGKQLTFEDERVDWEGNTFKVVQLLNSFQGYEKDRQLYLNDINNLKELIKNGEEVDLNTEKLIAKKKEFAKWKLDYMNQEFTDEFYKKYELWEDEIGQKLKEKVDNIFDQINQIQATSLLTGNELSQIEVDKIDSLLKEYKLLGSVVQLDGSSKTNYDQDGNYTGELDKAQRMQEIRKLNNEIFEWKDNKNAFEKAKQRHSEYIISKGIEENSPEYLKEMQVWEDNNTRTVISQDFYDEREEIFQEINDLLSVYKTDDDNSDFEDTWKEIKNIVYGHRDEDNQPIGTEITSKAAKKIKVATERLEEIKKSVTQASGLSKTEQSRLSELIVKLQDKSINSTEKEELKALFDKQKSNGLSESSKKRLSILFEQLKNLQSRIPTEYYVDSFNNLSQKYNVTIDNSGNLIEITDRETKITPVLTSPVLNKLLENEDFKDWFEANHIQVEVFNSETKQSELQWQRLYQWNRIIPNDSEYIQIKPAQKYSYRVVKDEYKSKQEVGVTVDNKGNFLPKLKGKDDRYLNKEYFRLKNSNNPTDQALSKLLDIHTNYLLKGQENIPDKNKLYLDLPRLRKSKTERNIKLLKQLYEKPSEIPSTIWNGIVSKFNSLTDFNEDEGNYEAVFADKYGNEYTSIPIKYTGKLDAEDVSLDIFKAIMKYTYSAKLNQKLIELSPVSNALQRVLGEPDFKPLELGKKIIGKQDKSPKAKSNVRAQAIQSITRRVFEGQEKKMELGKRAETVIGLIKGLTVIKTIAFDAPASVANVINAEVQNFINASNGYISHSNLGTAHNRFFTEYVTAFQKDYWENKIGEKSLQSQIFDLYNFVQSHTFEEKIGEKVSQSKVKDALALNWLTNHREWGELFVQTVNGLAYLDATKVQQGENTISLLDAYELDKNGKLQLKEGISEEWSPTGAKFKELKEKIENHNSRIHGNYAKGIDKPEIETFTIFSVIVMMKRFFTAMFQNRFAAFDVKLTKYGIRSTARFNTRVGKEHGYYLKTLDTFANKLESKLQTGEFQSLTPDEKIALLKTTLDVSIMMIAGLILKYALDFDPDDEDKYKKLKKNSWLTNQLIYQAARLQTETSTFLNPRQYGEFIFDSPVIWSTLKSWLELIRYSIGNLSGDPNSYYKKDYGLYKKGESKAKARLYKVTGIEKTLNLQEEDAAITNYLKMRAR